MAHWPLNVPPSVATQAHGPDCRQSSSPSQRTHPWLKIWARTAFTEAASLT